MDSILDFFRSYGLQILLTAVISYLLGSISFSILFTKKFEKTDIRKMGSGNAGFTNVLRSVGILPAILTLVGDFGKGVVAVLIGRLIFQSFSLAQIAPYEVTQYGTYLAGFCCLMGHIFPCYFGFKGGKGVLTTAAMILLIDWRVFLLVLAVFALVFVCSRIISLSSIIAAALYPVCTFLVTYFIDYRPNRALPTSEFTLHYVVIVTAISFIVGVVIVVKHRENIKRILNGTEKKITPKKHNKNA